MCWDVSFVVQVLMTKNHAAFFPTESEGDIMFNGLYSPKDMGTLTTVQGGSVITNFISSIGLTRVSSLTTEINACIT